MQVLFEMEVRNADPIDALEHNLKELGEADREFAENLLEGVVEKENDLKEALATHAPEWSLERMDPISRAILQVGAFEMLFMEDAPPAVIMDEGIEIAKEYGTVESGKFVNGVLNAIAKSTGRGGN